MAGNISSLGIGSGVLTADIIDKLKAADESVTVTPLSDKITFNKQKQEASTLLTSLMKSFKTNVSSLSDSLVFTNKNVSISGTLDATVTKGASVESFSLETITLAKKDVTKLGALSSKTTPIASGEGILKINDFEIAYNASTTLETLTQAIIDKAGDKVSASILKTGDDAYNLIVSSKQTGASEALTITDVGGKLDAALFTPYDEVTNPTGYKKTQTASDAKFKYNGIETTRSTNDISDLVYGLNLTLKKEGDSSNVNITSDYQEIYDNMKLFSDSYNTLMTNLKDTTTKNSEKGTQGVFIDNTFIRSIGRDLTRSVLESDRDGNSLANYGISIDKTGKMSFDKTVLESKLKEDPKAVELLFAGGITSAGVEKTGIFETIDEKMANYTSSGKMLSTFDTNLKTEATKLEKEKTAAQKALDARYETMIKKFAAYDSMINKINTQFASLKSMIDAEANSDN